MLSLNTIFEQSKIADFQPDRHNDDPLVIPRPAHTLSRAQISQNALHVLYGLKDAGFEAYLVGGCVRDLLLGHEPKDFDVATNALPEQVHKLFKRSQLIGRRFKLVHVRFGREMIEVATFRAPPAELQDEAVQERIVEDNVYGTLKQDAWRRDFTINALYYNIRDFSIVDFTGGISDLQKGNICLIGDVETRYREDPVRMLRAIRFVGKLGLRLEKNTERFIPQLANLLDDIPAARLFDEVLKLYLTGNAAVTHELLGHYGVFDYLFPETASLLHSEQDDYPRTLIIKALENTDSRINLAKPVNPAFLFAALLWEPLRQRWQYYQQRKIPPLPAMHHAASDVFLTQVKRVAVPKRFSLVSRDIWQMQIRLAQRQGKRAYRLFEHPKFRAAYDFLLLRVEAGEPLQELADWWTTFQEVTQEERQKMVDALAPAPTKKRRRRRRKKPATKTD